MYKIGDFSKVTGASIRTLRYYDKIDLFKPDEIDLFTGYRYYSEGQIDDYKLIVKLKEVGFSLEEIKSMWGNFTIENFENKKEELLKSKQYIDRQVKEIDRLKTHIQGGKWIKEPKFERYKVKTLFESDAKDFKIVKSDYDNLVIYNGITIKERKLAKAVQNGDCDYYLVYNNNIVIDDFWIYHRDNNLCLPRINEYDSDSLFDNVLFMKTLVKLLVNNNTKLTIKLLDNPLLNYRHRRALAYGFTCTQLSSGNEGENFKVYELKLK